MTYTVLHDFPLHTIITSFCPSWWVTIVWLHWDSSGFWNSSNSYIQGIYTSYSSAWKTHALKFRIVSSSRSLELRLKNSSSKVHVLTALSKVPQINHNHNILLIFFKAMTTTVSQLFVYLFLLYLPQSSLDSKLQGALSYSSLFRQY